mgnify:CR=1 FL=1
MQPETIQVKGARQNNLKNIDVSIPTNCVTVVTGVSGSGKSSLVFDTIYSEGQRRYVETFSPYARQFLERMDKPQAESVEGIPPAIAVDQTNPVKTSRSTVGTMTELNDHLKLLFARVARLYCRHCGEQVQRDTPETIYDELKTRYHRSRESDTENLSQDSEEPISGYTVTFPVQIPENFSPEEIRDALSRQGFTRIQRHNADRLEVVQDRLPFSPERRKRLVEALERALHHGDGYVIVYPLDSERHPMNPLRFSTELHCAQCDVTYRDPTPNLFSFNSPLGACDTCRGFGRVIDIDWELVVPDETKSLEEGAIRPWQSASYEACQHDLLHFAMMRDIPVDAPWGELSSEQKEWVLEGESSWGEGGWYGVRRFFEWLETKSYRMHIRVLLSRYRAYHLCPACCGARLKPESLQWRIGGNGHADTGYNFHDVLTFPLQRTHEFFETLQLPSPLDEATEMLMNEIRSRLTYLKEVGLGYLTLDRQSRTLSGGEVQRINLTTALGTSLVNTLFVLDEPSIGLHARDINRLIQILYRLRDAGNTLLVVEHDPQVIAAADHVIDLGPGPGERGGHLVFTGRIGAFFNSGNSLTAEYLRGEKSVTPNLPERASGHHDASSPPGRALRLRGARAHNLKDIDVEIPLNHLVCISGVSGSGKSTLIQDTCYNALKKLKHQPAEQPGPYREFEGHEQISDVVLVDQSPIGKTTRSNPASYVGAFDAIRKLFSKEPLARERGYTAGTFSFNSPKGQCPTCSGNGFEHVEMQFLSDVYLRCSDCDGHRFRGEILEVKLPPPGPRKTKGKKGSSPSWDGQAYGAPKSIAEVLEMTVSEASQFFRHAAEVQRKLAPLQAVGLGYMKLGQPVPTLSGGEAQRLKLAGHLAQHTASKGKQQKEQACYCFLFDEPTTGLHFEDVATLLQALRQLIRAGHSVVIIEHNLDVLRAADWIIDLGPEGGDEGGEVIACGSPEEIAEHEGSYTGQALREAELPFLLPSEAAPSQRYGRVPEKEQISIRHAREHNLKNTNISIPRGCLSVITGISGSGKSTVAFDILFAEGQRRYLESMNAYARQIVQPVSRPDVDSITGIPPSVAIEQRSSRGGPKSTVATVTEVYHFLRLLLVKLGRQHCPECAVPIEAQSQLSIKNRIFQAYRGKKIRIFAPLIVARKGYYTDLAEWAGAKGYSHLRVDGTYASCTDWPRLDRFREHDIDLPVGETKVIPGNDSEIDRLLGVGLAFGKGTLYVGRVSGKDRKQEEIFSTKRVCPQCGRSFPELDPRLFSFNSKHGWCSRCHGKGTILSHGREVEESEDSDAQQMACPVCNGARLCREALAVTFRGQSIADLTGMTVQHAEQYFRSLELKDKEAEIARDLRAEVCSHLQFLMQVGLSYLTLDRSATTLSGGEAQRIRLAAQLGSNLRGVCYILDEPTIGLHARDNRRLLDTLHQLQTKGNTVVVVEHDEDTIKTADHIIDLGPGAGTEGGTLVAEGDLQAIKATPASVTGQTLSSPLLHPLVRTRRAAGDKHVRIDGARLHNLKDIQVDVPLGRLVCVTGVSGSGKSTLIREILYNNAHMLLSAKNRKKKHEAGKQLHGCDNITGLEGVKRTLEVDQKPIGKTPRSCPATYVGFWDRIRKLFAQTPEANIRGYGPSRFSFNVAEGRCPECKGQGVKKIQMSFMPDVTVTCEACKGLRFTPETLTVEYKEKNIGEILAMSVDEAEPFFTTHPSIHRPLRLMQDIGLGYLKLGQQSPTLSGGEAQRIKLVTELAKAAEQTSGSTHGNLYILEEPTIGLHMADIEKLTRVLHRLVDAGNTVVVIEHNLDIIAEADWIIDLGPEGGDKGGSVVAKGTPRQVAQATRSSHTGATLNQFLQKRGRS